MTARLCKNAFSRGAAVLVCAALAPWAVHAAASAPARGFTAAAARLMTDYTERGQFSGYVLVAHDGVPVFAQGFGFADRETRRPATRDTRFRIGSITKHFTATAVLMLAAEGKVKLDDPVRDYYAGAPAAWNDITVRHLLELRSGIFNLTDVQGFPGPAARDPRPEILIGLVRDMPLGSPPGTRFAYNNSDSTLLGLVIERASGTSYRRFIEQRVLASAGMTNSGYEFTDVAPERRAVGYNVEQGTWQPARLFSSDLMYSAGALHSTADDLLKWDQLLYGVSAPATAWREAGRALGDKQSYHFGFFTEPFAGRPSEYAGGGQPGFLSLVYRFPDDRMTIIVLANVTTAPVLEIGQKLARLYFGVPPPPPPRPVAVAAAQLDRYVGTYELYPGVRLVLSRNGSDLHLRRLGGMPPAPPEGETLIAVGPGSFLGADCRIDLDAGTEGPAVQLRYTIPRLKTERVARRVEASPPS